MYEPHQITFECCVERDNQKKALNYANKTHTETSMVRENEKQRKERKSRYSAWFLYKFFSLLFLVCEAAAKPTWGFLYHLQLPWRRLIRVSLECLTCAISIQIQSYEILWYISTTQSKEYRSIAWSLSILRFHTFFVYSNTYMNTFYRKCFCFLHVMNMCVYSIFIATLRENAAKHGFPFLLCWTVWIPKSVPIYRNTYRCVHEVYSSS